MTLPATVDNSNFTAAAHAGWHNEIHGGLPWLALPTDLGSDTIANIAYHESLHYHVGGGLDTTISAGQAGHYSDHQAVHAFCADLPARQNTFETVTAAGTVITAGNSGGTCGHAFSATVGSPTFDATAWHGTRSMRILPTANTTHRVQWDTTVLGTAFPRYCRLYLRLTGWPDATNTWPLVGATDGANNRLGGLNINSAGKLLPVGAAGGGGVASTTTLTLNTWFRIEVEINKGATAQTVARIYATPDSTTITETVTSTATDNSAQTVASYMAGWCFDRTTVGAADGRIDDLAWD